MRTRLAGPDDAAAIARIYNEGIEDRVGTFETEPRSPEDVGAWIDAGYPLVVGEDGGEVVAWASAPPYRAHRRAYAGEFPPSGPVDPRIPLDDPRSTL